MNTSNRWWNLYQTLEQKVNILEGVRQTKERQSDKVDAANKLSVALEVHDIHTELFAYKEVLREMEALESERAVN